MENLQMLVSIGSLVGVFIAIWNVYRIKEESMQIEPILVYIQELRDITKQKEFPNNIIWPEEPK